MDYILSEGDVKATFDRWISQSVKSVYVIIKILCIERFVEDGIGKSIVKLIREIGEDGIRKEFNFQKTFGDAC